jgi:hypothetical protein
MPRNCWAVICPEPDAPGLWGRWRKYKCVAIGWPPRRFHLYGPERKKSWASARKRALEVKPGDIIIPFLKYHRFGTPGVVTRIRIEDKQWEPTVPEGGYSRNPGDPDLGRRIEVRWLTRRVPPAGTIAAIPSRARKPRGEVRQAIERVRSDRYERFMRVIENPRNYRKYRKDAFVKPSEHSNREDYSAKTAHENDKFSETPQTEDIAETSATIAQERAAGFQSSVEIRKCVEDRAMEMAKKCLEKRGYDEFRDTSRHECYDYTCQLRNRLYYVEVKGTQTHGDSVILTHNEVKHRRAHAARSIFVIVHSIVVEKSKKGLCATGGTDLVYKPWKIRDDDLKPTIYRWRVS